jgi:hypothetical protein
MAKKFLLLNVVVVFTALTASAAPPNAPVTWGSPTTISGDTDVSLDGSLVAAFNMVGGNVTVNGVTFAAFPVTGGSTSATNGNFSFSESPGILVTWTTLGSASAPFSNLSANYQTLLSTAISTDANNTLTLVMSGLVTGQQYEFEWWLNAASNSSAGFLTTATATNSVSLDDNTTNANGGVGQYVIGTFTANAGSETITFNGTSTGQAPTINAFQLRAVPEPSTMSILLLGGVVISGARFLRRKN